LGRDNASFNKIVIRWNSFRPRNFSVVISNDTKLFEEKKVPELNIIFDSKKFESSLDDDLVIDYGDKIFTSRYVKFMFSESNKKKIRVERIFILTDDVEE
jgi:hypothetical protein